MRSWDSRSQRFSFSYDTLRRPVDRTVSVSGSEKLLGRIVYGDLLATPETTNHIGRVYRVYDGAGVATTVAFDFEGHPTSEQRQLVSDKTNQPDWSALLGEGTIAAMATAAASLLDSETFEASSERDALGRVLVAISPDDSEVLYSYDEGGNLQKVELKHRGSSTAQTVVGDITYNARGQREQVIYGSTSSPTMTTSYGYDPQTYRLAHMSTIRESDDASLQGLHYHYDPVGNITDIRDTAQQTVYFQNSVVEAANSYEYDAVYRLIEATGREHATQGTTQRTHEQLPVGPQPMTSDPSAMRRYTQKYTYDSVGNILVMQHIPASGSGWTRYYQYDEAGNRLEATSAPGDDPEGPYTHTYSYDNHGSMTAMPHLSSMIWNHQDELQEVTVGTETVYFQYAGGMRSRKYTEKSGTTTEERIYLGAFEIYRKRVSGTLDLERESLHISDGTGRICIVETKTVDGGSAVGSPVGIWRYQLGNHLGSAATEVDESGEVISYEEYHPYGTSAYRAVDSSVEVSAKRYRYTGMERDEETSLEYHSARYYAPWLGRWTAADPIGLGDGVNRYRYAAGNPVSSVDRNGNENGPTFFEEYATEPEEQQFWVETEDWTGNAPGQNLEDATRRVEERNVAERAARAEAAKAEAAKKARAEAEARAQAESVQESKEFLERKSAQYAVQREARAQEVQDKVIEQQSRELSFVDLTTYGSVRDARENFVNGLDALATGQGKLAAKQFGWGVINTAFSVADVFTLGRASGANAVLKAEGRQIARTTAQSTDSAGSGAHLSADGGAGVPPELVPRRRRSERSESPGREARERRRAEAGFVEDNWYIRQETVRGEVLEIRAEIHINGDEITFAYFEIFPVNKNSLGLNSVGARGTRAALRPLLEEARDLGFKSARITAIRATGEANVKGRIINRPIDLQNL